ncbi:Ig-like and fibronectin type-III domain-containing protein 2 isoform X2 [Lingula anatina]|nr:Ig-like and fibronectin type-III domain-containing protein 2 isoform X2 [Lingula anatina]|eukprot:XP_013407685.1 Ig-like and fibronectin type-III domain-containing protein 2 isoform X2 [Lingula anatina]
MALVAVMTALMAVQCAGEQLMPSIPYPISKEIEAVEGTDIQMECSVSNLGEHDVLWIFLQHNATISRNLQILSAETQHYTITRPLGGEYSHFTLNLLTVVQSDAGLYECQVQGTSVKQTVTLTVTGAVTVPRPVVPPHNFTSCCTQAGVAPPCGQACAPSTLDIHRWNPATACAADIPKILTCGAGDRNHYPCCQRRQLPTHCLRLCVGDIPDSLGVEYADCVNKSMDILACYEEGQALLPGPPRSVSALGLTTNIILVSWEPPTQIPDVGVTGYKVFFRKAGTSLPFNSTETLSSNMAQLITDPSKNVYIEPYTLYEIYVIVVNQHGASLPSYIVEARSLPRMPERSNTTSVSSCCRRHNISSLCMPLCQNTVNIKLSTVLQCTAELGTVYSCLAGGRNHTGCCVARDVIPDCLSYCGGQNTAASWSQLQCALQLPQIETCIMEGGALIPAPPQNIRLRSVSSNSAELQWDVDTPETVKYFQIFLRNKTSGGNKTEIQASSTARQALLPPLVPNTLYEVYMVARGQNGSSIPSSELVFMTYPPPEPTTQPTVLPPPQPHNWTECCIKRNVPSFCLPLCTYELRNDIEVGMESLATYALCITQLTTILACGADQRNHRPCCENIVLQESCQPLCALGYNQSFSLEWSHVTCIVDSQDIIKCMKQGVDSFPSSPTNFTVYNVTTHTASLDWDAPNRTSSGHRVEWYSVQHRKVTTEQLAWNEVNTTETRYNIPNLEPDTQYEIQVVAFNQNGSSLPSPKISIWTAAEEVPTTPAPNGTFVRNDTDCCVNLNVSPSCQPYCYFTHPDAEVPATCVNDILKVFACRGKDHQNEPCCRRRNVPGMCLGVCRGEDVSRGGLVAELVCPLYFAPIMSCIKEGLASFPSPPRRFRITSQGPTFLEMSWLPPLINRDNARYDLYYRRAREDEVTKIMKNITSPVTLTDVEAGKTYEVYLVALNDHGASTPTPVITATTEYRIAAYIVMAEVVTGRVPREGGSVTLRCEARGTQPIHIFWTRNGKILSKDSIYTNNNITRRQQGEYMCHANNGIGEEATETVDVWVLYQPTIENGTPGRLAVIPSYSVNVYIHCWFGGNITAGYWKHNSVLISNRRVLMGMNRNASLGLTEVYLVFRYIVEDDLGRYECIGENSLGNISRTITLYDPQDVSTTTSPTSGIPPATRPMATVKECCRSQGVSERCQVGCSFDIDLDAFLVNSARTRFQCLSEAPKLLACAADGRDHEKCCREAGVPETCHNACKGIASTNFSSDPCVPYIGTIVNCLESGRDLIPSAPLDVRYLNTMNHVSVMWDAPNKNYFKIQKYIVFYRPKTKDNSAFKTLDVAVGLLSVDIPFANLTENSTYEIYVVAWNHHGQSQPSNRITVDISSTSTHSRVPFPPRNLRTNFVGFTEVHLLWDLPLANTKGPLLYHVKYYEVGNTRHYHNATKLTYLKLKNLKSGTTYEFRVAAENTYGSSSESNLLTVQTKGQAGGVSSGQSGVNGVGIALGVLVPLLLLAIAAVGIMYFFYRRQRNNSRFKESVSFENPGYASHTNTENIQISGLPGEPTFMEIANSNQQPVSPVDGSTEVVSGGARRGNGIAHQPNGEPAYMQLQNRQVKPQDEVHYAVLQRNSAQAERNSVQEGEYLQDDIACNNGGSRDKKKTDTSRSKRKAAEEEEDGGGGFKYVSLSSLTNGNVVKDKKSHHQNSTNISDPSSNGHCVSHSENNAATLDITDMQPVEANRIHLHYTDPLESAAV